MNFRDELLQIREDYGGLTPAAVLEAARPKGHPLHAKVFDRPVKEAAEEYYLSRAQRLIMSVKIRFPTIDPNDTRRVRAFVAVPTPDERGMVYEPSELVVTDPFLMTLKLREMERDWQRFKSRWEDFAEFGEMIRRDLGEQAA